MIWASNKRVARAVIAGVLAATLGGTAVAGPVVIRATGPSAKAYPAGRLLADNAQLTLKAGDTVLLLDARGTRTVSGPGTFAAVATGTRAGVAQTASRIIANQGTSERRGGAVRGGAPTNDGRSPNLWLVDTTKSGTICVANPAALQIWRPAAATAAELKISSASASGTIAMASGAAIGNWPAAVPVTDGAEYTLWMTGASPTKIRLVTVPVPATTEETASMLIAKGCQAQLDLLVANAQASGGAG